MARKAHDQAQASSSKGSETIATGDGFTIEANHAADRVQVFFDGKPDDATRTALKSASWHWSRTESAWQRKLTDAAIVSAKHLLGADSVIEQVKAERIGQEQIAAYAQPRLF